MKKEKIKCEKCGCTVIHKQLTIFDESDYFCANCDNRIDQNIVQQIKETRQTNITARNFQKGYDMRFANKNGTYKGRKNGFNFTIYYSEEYCAFYVVASHRNRGIRYNSMWSDKKFENFNDASEFCETFDYRKCNCCIRFLNKHNRSK